WKSAEKAADAAAAMGITAERLHSLGLVDAVIQEPLGGAHRDPTAMAATLKEALISRLDGLVALPLDRLLAERHRRLMGFGNFKEA
ncbi:MAG TPA: acetyl-CoA carboxylase carboxyl transferase subunit alpha, partial [Gammaproteobacteria bacterium]|nr:acetyl-CoA carboxylase carboxyl transferase subunit alpha [Gammaproteobacteria bacterium]